MSRASLRGGYLEGEARGSNRSKGTEKRYANTQYPPHRWGSEQWVGANRGTERGAARRTDLEGPRGEATVGKGWHSRQMS